MSTSLHVSANQWRTSILKACIGSNVARGVAEDIADAGLALLATGNDPLPSLLQCLADFEVAVPATNWPRQNNPTDLGHLQVLHHGPSAIDLSQAGRQPTLTVDSPELLLGLAQARSHSHGLDFQIAIDDGNWSGLDDVMAVPLQLSASTKMALRARSSDEPKPLSTTNLPQPSRQDWRALQNFADKILVPADASSREDAGVGDGQTDND